METAAATSPTALPPALIVTEAARRLGVTAPTVWAMAEKKQLAGFKLGTRRFVTTASFDAYVASVNALAAAA